MKIHTNQLPNATEITASTILIGGGIAGITLANQLADAGHDVAILESGGDEFDERTQELYAGKATLEGPGEVVRQQDQYLTASRFRYFGGSGNRWGGVCVPLDPVDFLEREWVPDSGWPLTLDELKPFYNRACDRLEIPHFYGEDGSNVFSEPPLGTASALLESRPHYRTRYTGLRPDGPYQDWLASTAAHPGIRVYLGANVTHVQLTENGEGVESLRVQTLDGKTHTAKASTYVLATGGIENARLLLASRDVASAGIGNDSDWLGRAFQGHAILLNGFGQLLTLLDPAKLSYYTERPTTRESYVLGTTAEAQRAIRGVNFSIYVRDRTHEQTNGTAVKALAQRLAGAKPEAMTLLMAMFGIEHTPNRDSRIELIPDSLDELGQPRARMTWRHSAVDFEGFERTLAQITRELGLHDLGRLRWSDLGQATERFLQIGARHHMGTTRMASDPSRGVVDAQSRVHGVDNLYIAGSSIFPTSGLANPTLTILALTYRLGDHLLARSGGAA